MFFILFQSWNVIECMICLLPSPVLCFYSDIFLALLGSKLVAVRTNCSKISNIQQGTLRAFGQDFPAMAHYNFRIHHLSGSLVGKVSLPGSATVRDILSNLTTDDLHVRRKLMYEGTLLKEDDVLQSLNFGSDVELQLVHQKPQVQLVHQKDDEVFAAFEGCRKWHVALCGPPRSGKTSILHRCAEDTFREGFFPPVIWISRRYVFSLFLNSKKCLVASQSVVVIFG